MNFNHTPVLLKECIDNLNIKPNGIYIDGTLGGGGHSAVILSKLTTGKLIGIDKDKDALAVCKQKFEDNKNFVCAKSDFKDFDTVLDDLHIDNVDGILLDLGVSSYQLDEKERGFSYMGDAGLDMRMDQTADFSALNIVNEYSEKELTHIFFEYGEEKFSKIIASNIVKARNEAKIETTLQLAEIIKKSIPIKYQIKGGNPCKRVFQAIRIEVNGELDMLYECVIKMVKSLKVGGRLCIITFHSLEDRIVKNAFKECITDCVCPKNMPICICNHRAVGKLICKKPIEPTVEECELNSRSKSSKLRVIERI